MKAGIYEDTGGLVVHAAPNTELEPYDVRVVYEDGRVVYFSQDDFEKNYKEA